MLDPDIDSCVCGEDADLLGNDGLLIGGYWVCCGVFGDCWSGPTRKTEEEAAEAWNKVMRAAKGAK